MMNSDEGRLEAFMFRTYKLREYLSRRSGELELDAKALFETIERSRRIEQGIDYVYTAIAQHTVQIGFGVRSDVSSRVIDFLRDRVWEGGLPSWVSDCLTLGSFVPIIDNIQIVTCVAGDVRVECLRQTLANTHYSAEGELDENPYSNDEHS